MLQVRAAHDWGTPPVEFMGGKTGWTHVSRLLAAAWTYLESIRCPRGHLTDDTTDPNADGWFEVDDSVICEACAELDRYHEEHKDSPPEPGRLLYVRDTALEPEEG